MSWTGRCWCGSRRTGRWANHRHHRMAMGLSQSVPSHPLFSLFPDSPTLPPSFPNPLPHSLLLANSQSRSRSSPSLSSSCFASSGTVCPGKPRVKGRWQRGSIGAGPPRSSSACVPSGYISLERSTRLRLAGGRLQVASLLLALSFKNNELYAVRAFLRSPRPLAYPDLY